MIRRGQCWHCRAWLSLHFALPQADMPVLHQIFASVPHRTPYRNSNCGHIHLQGKFTVT